MTEIDTDTPESSVAAIKAIVQEEARRLGATVRLKETENVGGRETTIDLSFGARQLQIFLSWAQNTNATAGSGHVGVWDTELLSGDPPSWNLGAGAPFR